jgi:hypothetical protein
VRLVLDQFGPAPMALGAKADLSHHGVPATEQLTNLVTRRVETPHGCSAGLRHLTTAATNTGFDGLRGADALDVVGLPSLPGPTPKYARPAQPAS